MLNIMIKLDDSGSSGYMLFYRYLELIVTSSDDFLFRMIEPDEKRDEIIELPEKLQKALDLELEADRIREEVCSKLNLSITHYE